MQASGQRNGVAGGNEGKVTDSMRPISADRFGFAEARHLLWRAGFGGTPTQIQTLASWGPERAVEYILEYDDVSYEDVEADAFDRHIMRPPSEQERQMLNQARRARNEEAVARFRAMRQEAQRNDRRQMVDVQRWWMRRLIETPRPLEEKMTLFWHGHFATSYRTIENSYHMFMQNQFFRKHAVGNFADLLFGIIRDPAMLAYLDNNDSRRQSPNENLAREIMELFSLGVGNYTERDIKEGARALTGYTFDDDEFVFNERNHDDGAKRILGRSGTMDGDDFVKAILAKRDCSSFIAGKLYGFFCADFPTGDEEVDRASERARRDLASVMLRNRYEVKPVLRRLFLSEHFYSEAVRLDKIKSPVELVVGAVRSMQTPVRDLTVLLDAMGLMGQNLFYPPSVKGWDGGRSWINTSTMFVRQNLMVFLLTGKMPRGYDALAEREKYDPMPLLADLDAGGAADRVDATVDYLIRFALGKGSGATREELRGFLAKHGGRVTSETVTALLLLVTAMPEYQLC